MAAAQFAQMGSMPNMIKNDLDMDTFFDFSQATPSHDQRSPSRASVITGPSTQTTNNLSYDDADDRQIFAGPSHEYDRFRQQTGIPIGDGSLSHLNQPIDSFGGFNSGIDEMSFGMDGWATGLDMDADMNMGFAPNMSNNFYPPSNNSRGDFIDPTHMDAVEEPQSNVGRLWPGMHQQQAQQVAMAKARAQQQQQQQLQQQQFMRHQQMQQQQHHQMQQQQSQPHQTKAAGKQRASSQQTDPHTEESIARLLNNMRQNTHAATIADEDDEASNSFMANMSRMKKDEEEMDDDERLLASEEGKKLSSKERRQLRNKVSARAFRSRRKGKIPIIRFNPFKVIANILPEYIGQLEGDLAIKDKECSTLKSHNNALTEENERYRALIQTLLRHPSFTPFLDDISKDPAFINSQQTRQPQPQQASTPAPSVSSSTPSQTQNANNHRQMQNVKHEGKSRNLSTISEAPVDLSLLNLNHANGNFAQQQQQQQQQSQNVPFDFSQPQIYAAHQLPQGPSPLDLTLDLVKQNHDEEDFSFNGMNW